MKDVYIYRIGHLGDTLVALPAIKKIWESHRDDNLILITNEPEKGHYVTAWDVLRHTGFFKEVVFYSARDGKSVLGLLRRIRGGKNGKALFYMVVDIPVGRFLRDYSFFRVLCGLREIYGLKGGIGKQIRRDSGGRLLRVDGESTRILKALGLDGGGFPEPPFLHPPADAREKAEKITGGTGGGKILIALGVGAKGPAKIWFRERFRELCRRLLDFSGAIEILVVGGRAEYEAGEYVRAEEPGRIKNLAGNLNIIESAAILEKCGLFVGNDSGAMHLAAAMGTPVVGIFSARSNPGRWEPFGEGHVIIRKDVECAGCFLDVCVENNMKCLDMISVEEVFEKAKGRIEAGGGWTI